MQAEKSQSSITYNELYLLNQIGQEFSSSLNFDSVIDRIMGRVKDVLGCEASSVILLDEVKDTLVFYAASGAGAKEVKGLSIPKGKGIAGWVFDNKIPVVVREANKDERFYPEIDIITGIKTQSLICVPIRKEDKTLGVIEGINKQKGFFDEKDLVLLVAISQLAGISIENSIIHKNLEVKKDELLQMNREMEEFVHIVSHELQTPLASIKGYIDLIKGEMDDVVRKNKDFKTYLIRMDENCRNMLNFIRRLLSYVRLKDNRISIEEFNPMGVLDEIFTVLENEIREKKAEIVIRSQFKNIQYDRFLFYHILLNLLQNSLKYSSKSIKPVIEIGVEEKERELNFFVRDNGKGLSREDRERIFNIYERGGNRTFGDGYGIGLAFVKKAVELFHGTVWVEAKHTEGSTFYFSIPKKGI